MQQPETHGDAPRHDCEYRVEADRAMRDYDALELDAGVMYDALRRITTKRLNRVFDPWAVEVAADALGNVSERVTSLG